MKVPPSRVLLVEDDPRMPELLSVLLQDDHITLASAGDAPAALKHVREAAVDLILLDLGLPGMNGFELLRQLKASPAARKPSPSLSLPPGTAPATSCGASSWAPWIT